MARNLEHYIKADALAHPALALKRADLDLALIVAHRYPVQRRAFGSGGGAHIGCLKSYSGFVHLFPGVNAFPSAEAIISPDSSIILWHKFSNRGNQPLDFRQNHGHNRRKYQDDK